MNNAANNIDAKSKSLKDILFEKHYKVGYFQREYKWQRNHIEDLLIDLERSFNSNWIESHVQKDVANYDKYYMGPIVLFDDSAEYSIVDGQQRLTSFILLMIFLNHQFRLVFDVKDKYKGYIYSDYFGTSSYNINIDERATVLEHLFKNKDVDESTLANESCRNIFERYNDIVELFPLMLLTKKVLPLFSNWLTEKLVFIEILTQTSESAYTIFETMNDRGLNLTQTELLKSFLLSNVKDETKIRELDTLWKEKISQFNSVDNDQDFFKAWLRAKYAISIRTTDKGSANEDFEKIATRFSSWAQENTKYKNNVQSKIPLDYQEPSSFYFFVQSDFDFYSELYIKLRKYELNYNIPEHRFRLISYKGVSSSLSYPLILSPILKSDDEETINHKIDVVVRYLDSFGVYRMLLNEPITHSSIRNFIYLKIKEIRDIALPVLIDNVKKEIHDYKNRFIRESYIRFDSTISKYILSRIFLELNPEIDFENIYFQRRKDSFILYQFLKLTDFESENFSLHKGLKDILISSLVSYTIVPRKMVFELDSCGILKRIELLSKNNLLLADNKKVILENINLKDFFINREKFLKDIILSVWKI